MLINVLASAHTTTVPATPSITPTAGAVVYAYLSGHLNPGPNATGLTISGLSGTWTPLGASVWGTRRASGLYECLDWSGSGALSLDITGGTQQGMGYVIFEVVGGDTVIPSVDAASGAFTAQTSNNRSPAATPPPGTKTLAFVSIENNDALGFDSANWDEIVPNFGEAGGMRRIGSLVSETADTTPAFSWTTSSDGFSITLTIVPPSPHIDDSTPAQVFNADSQCTTAPFTPPAGSLIVAELEYDTGGTPAPGISSSLSDVFTLHVGSQPGVRIWTTPGTNAARTITATDGQGGFGAGAVLKVYVITGQHATTPVGNTGSGTATGNTSVNGYTSSANNSLGLAIARVANGLNTPSSTDDETAQTADPDCIGMSIAKSAATPTSGTVVTFNLGHTNGSASWQWAAIEIVPPGSGGTIYTETLDTTITATTEILDTLRRSPTNVVATPTGTTTATVTWTAVSGATGYDIERNGSVIATDHSASPFNDTGLSPATSYDYRVRAVFA